MRGVRVCKAGLAASVVNLPHMGKLPEGYWVLIGRGLPEDPFSGEFRLERPDGSTVATFPLKRDNLKTIERAAWRDHRERTLRPVEDEETP